MKQAFYMNAEKHDQLHDVTTWVECFDENFEHTSCWCCQILPMISSIEFCLRNRQNSLLATTKLLLQLILTATSTICCISAKFLLTGNSFSFSHFRCASFCRPIQKSSLLTSLVSLQSKSLTATLSSWWSFWSPVLAVSSYSSPSWRCATGEWAWPRKWNHALHLSFACTFMFARHHIYSQDLFHCRH